MFRKCLGLGLHSGARGITSLKGLTLLHLVVMRPLLLYSLLCRVGTWSLLLFCRKALAVALLVLLAVLRDLLEASNFIYALLRFLLGAADILVLDRLLFRTHGLLGGLLVLGLGLLT